MKQPKINKIITFDSNKDWTDIQNSLLIKYFNSLGLYETVNSNRILFKRNAHKANDFIKTGTKRDFFKVIRMAEIKLIKNEKHKMKIEVSISLSYLIILSIGLGISFCLGMIYSFNEIGLTAFLIIAFLVMILTFSIGFINITSKMDNLTYELMRKNK